MAAHVALALWTVGALAFAALPEGSPGRYAVATAVYCVAAAFALVCAARAVRGSRGAGRVLWSLLGAGLAVGLVADLGWASVGDDGLGGELSYQHVAYLVSYLLLAGAMVRLVHSATDRITSVALLDALAVMLSTGVLVWYLLVGPALSEGGVTWGTLAVSSWPPFDAALIFLGLVALSSVRHPPYTGALTSGFLAFAAADTAYLAASSSGGYSLAGWPDLLWALGLVLLGLAALGGVRAAEHEASVADSPGEPIASWRVLAFWLGPLSPPLHLALVLVLGAFRPPLPPYVPVCAAVLFVYLAVRAGLVSYVTDLLTDEGEEQARRRESARVLGELHGAVKGGIGGLSLMLRSALDAERRGDRATVRRLLEGALRSAREIEYGVTRPYEELRVTEGGAPVEPVSYLRERLRRFQEYFGVRTHDDLQAPLDDLSPAEVMTVYRIVTEAFWNVARHSGARNLWLDSRRVGPTLLVRIRDDGRGFDAGDPPPGLGLRYMRRRAEEVGARLDVISSPGAGTTVQLRFERR